MKNVKTVFFAIVTTLCLIGASQLAFAKGKESIAVMPVEGGPGVSADLKESVRLELESQLVKSGKVNVIERAKLEQLSKEMMLSLEGVVDPASVQELGKVAGVSVFLFPRITSAWSQQNRNRIPIVNEDEVTVKAGFEIGLKLVKTETAKILASEKASGSYRITRMESEGGIPSKSGALATARSRALQGASGIVLGAIYPIKVAHYNSKTGVVTLNRGKDGLDVGKTLKVYAVGETIVDPDTGEVLGSDEEMIGQIKVTAVRQKLSKAKILDGSVEIGAICR
jgi:hypothetical protein